MIVVATKDRVLADTASALAVAAADATNPEFISAALRRLAGFACPCPASTLSRMLAESFQGLVADDQFGAVRLLADDLLERMVVQGDLLELSGVTSVDPLAGKAWLFAAPPAFVVRPGGAVIVLGVVADEVSPLPPALLERVEHQGPRRLLRSMDAPEDLAAILREIGLLELSEDAWMKPPRAEDAGEYLRRHSELLRQSPSYGAIEGLELIDPSAPTRYYRGRWTKPGTRSGTFVGRRPQAYGAPIWGLVRIAEGQPSHFLDLPLREAKYRGCDAAWRLQAAMDADRGSPQQFRIRELADGASELDFFGPIPSWVERRFELLGAAISPSPALISYRIADSEIEGSQVFLRTYLWLSESNE